MNTHQQSQPREGMIPVRGAELYCREIGMGEPVIILHGGPDFSHTYFLPEMDLLADSLRLIYYDQRGRGKSGRNVQPAEVSMASEMDDLEAVRKHFGLESTALLGHSWGGLLAMEYAIRFPERVSRLVLLSSAPASKEDYQLFQEDRLNKAGEDLEKLKILKETLGYARGDVVTDGAYYRVHFRGTVRKAGHLDRLIRSLRQDFTEEGILRARAIEKRLMGETWLASEYDLLPKLKDVEIPTLVMHGEHDLVPVVCAAHIALAIPDTRLVLMRDVGHFAFIEKPEAVKMEIRNFFQG